MNSTKGRCLVVGAGFAGAVHARQLAEAGYEVVVIDKRDHIAGNAFDKVDDNGIRVHRYGPHLFHTNNDLVVKWISRFSDWTPYTHRVRAMLENHVYVPIPVNIDTINSVYATELATEAEARAFLATISDVIPAPANAAEYLRSKIGRRLTDLFFRPYTKKMWNLDLEDLDSAVVRRIPLRYDSNDRYFPDAKYEMLPASGYTKMFENILDHSNISVRLQTGFERGMEEDYEVCFNSMPIDEYFGFVAGELPYRSIRFHHRTCSLHDTRSWSVTNYTDASGFTRETWWHLLPGHIQDDTGRATITVEEPCDYKENSCERYYPVKTSDGRYDSVYQVYKEMAKRTPEMIFIGRCGTYQYLDMDQVINQSLVGVNRWLLSREPAAVQLVAS